MSEIAIRTQVPKPNHAQRVGLNQYIYCINFALYLIKNWLEIAEIAIKPRRPSKTKDNQTKPDPNKTKQSRPKLVSLNQLT